MCLLFFTPMSAFCDLCCHKHLGADMSDRLVSLWGLCLLPNSTIFRSAFWRKCLAFSNWCVYLTDRHVSPSPVFSLLDSFMPDALPYLAWQKLPIHPLNLWASFEMGDYTESCGKFCIAFQGNVIFQPFGINPKEPERWIMCVLVHVCYCNWICGMVTYQRTELDLTQL